MFDVLNGTLSSGVRRAQYRGNMANITKRVGKKGTTYKAVIRMKGKPTATATFTRLTDCKAWVKETEEKIRKGRYSAEVEARKHTLADAIDDYVETCLPARKGDGAYIQGLQLAWWKSYIGEKSLLEINPSLLIQCKNHLKAEKDESGKIKRTGATVNRYLAVLSAVLTTCVKEWQWLEDNPLRRVSRYKETEGRVRFLSDNERERLLDASKNSKNKSLYLIVMLAISTGARHGEILGLTWDDVSFELRRLILRDTKNSETRAVPLVGAAFELLKEHGKVRRLDTTLVFPRHGIQGKSKPISTREAWVNVVKAAGIDDLKFHDLRHTCASYLAMNGASLAEIAAVLGHKTLQMVKRYAHLSEQHTLSVVERMNHKIFG